MYALVLSIMHGHGTANIDRHLRGLPHARAARLAAGGLSGDRRTIDAYRARMIVALFVVIIRSRRKTTRRGYASICQGYTVRQLGSLFTNPRTGRRFSRSAFDAQSWGVDRKGRDDCGMLVALERAGAFEIQQPPEKYADPRYLGRVRWTDADGNPRRAAFAQYWIRPADSPS